VIKTQKTSIIIAGASDLMDLSDCMPCRYLSETMKRRFSGKQAFLRLIFTSITSMAATCTFAGAGLTDVAESDPGLFMFMMILLCGFFAAIAALLAIAFTVLLLICILIACGLFTLSALVAWYQKSVLSGIRALIYSSSFVLGSLAGAMAGWIAFRLLYESQTEAIIIVGSAFLGGIGGLLTGRLLLYIIRKAYSRLSQHFS
jgi:hypothetical protein